jgi:alkylhydroperoxidase/carboxymuconolactone decarboxylase family protein YurZ
VVTITDTGKIAALRKGADRRNAMKRKRRALASLAAAAALG